MHDNWEDAMRVCACIYDADVAVVHISSSQHGIPNPAQPSMRHVYA